MSNSLPDAFAPLSDEERQRPAPMPHVKEEWVRIESVPANEIERLKPQGHPEKTHRYYDREGRIEQIIFRYVNKDGSKRFTPYTFCKNIATNERGWRKKGVEGKRSLYNLPELLERVSAPVIVTEGEKAADAIKELGLDYVAVTSSNGYASPAKSDWMPLKGRHAVIWGDNDDAGRKYVRSVKELLLQAGVLSLSIVEYDDSFADKWDAADALEEGWSKEKAEKLLKSAKRISIETLYPKGFNRNDGGVFWTPEGEDKDPIKICSPLDIIAHTHDENGENSGLLLQWVSPRSNMPHEWAMPVKLLSGDGREIREYLLDRGLVLHNGSKQKQKLLEYLQESQPVRQMTSVSRIGWHNDYYVMPGGTFPESENLVLQTKMDDYRVYQSKGSLNDWQSYIARYTEGNSRLVFAVSCAFAAPLMRLIGNNDSGGFHFIGNSSIGKSTTLKVAASVWGGNDERDFIEQWRATSNALERLAETHTDSLLLLDELGQADSRDIADTIYMLANNQGKKRMSKDAALKDSYRWRLLFISTGEVSLESKIIEAGKRLNAGLEVRFINIPADAGQGYGAFEKIHDEFEHPAEFARYLNERSVKYYGVPIRAFLKRLVNNKEPYLESVAQTMDAFKQEVLHESYDGQVARAAERFAMVAAGGELAIRMGVYTLEQGAALEAAERCFNDWMQYRGTSGRLEDAQIIKAVRLYLEKYLDSRFSLEGDEVRGERAGWKQKNVLVDGTPCEEIFYVSKEMFRNEICKGFDYKNAEAVLIKEGFLFPDGAGNATRNKTIQSAKGRRYWINGNILS
ncbi:MAG: DUF927 domain-containing protein [Rickettsiales bacterium]|nr:DUF927 domain-containing protein [Rickettsiales bacterium]